MLLSIKSYIMRGRKILHFFLVILLSPWISVYSQNVSGVNSSSNPVLDSLRSKGIIFGNFQKKPEIVLTVSQAVKFLQQRYQAQNWNNLSDPLRQAMGQLIFNASNPPFDSTISVLRRFPYDSINIPWDKFYIWEPMRVRIPVNILVPVPGMKLKQCRIQPLQEGVQIRLSLNMIRHRPSEYTYKSVTIHEGYYPDGGH